MTDQWAGRRFFGWRVVGGAFVLAIFGWGVGFYGPPNFLHQVQAERGWPLPLASAAVTLHFLVGAIVVANLPRLYRRCGLPVVTKAGAIALALGICGWSLAGQPWQLFLATLFSGAGWVAMGAAAVNAIVAPWFSRRRPAALAMAYNGASIGGVVFSPLWVALIGRFGFPAAAAGIGLVMAATVWLLADRLFAQTPQELRVAPDGDEPAAAAAATTAPAAGELPGRRLCCDGRFLSLAGGMAAGLFAQIGLIAHLFSLLVPGLGAQGAGLAMGLATAMAIAGRSLVGWLMPPRADRRLVASASYAVQIVGSLLFILAAGHDRVLLLLGVLLFGAGIGNATSLPPLIAQVEFAKADTARVATYAFAPAVFGALGAQAQDPWQAATGDMPVVFILAAIVQAIAIGCFLAGRRRGGRDDGRAIFSP